MRKIAYCKYYRLSTYSLWKIWTTVIKPKIMYGICTFSSINDKTFEELESLQYEAARIALGIKKHVPRIIIKNILNITTIKNSLKFLQIKLWNRYTMAPENMIIKKTFNEWKEYIDINSEKKYQIQTRSMKNDELNENYINFNKFKYIQKSPLSRAYKVIESLHKFEENENKNNKYNKLYGIDNEKMEDIFKFRKNQVMKAIPTYKERYPNNIEVCDVYETKPRALNNSYIFYLDGSCKPNPGPGAGAYYSPNFIIRSKLEPIMHDTTINYAELKAFDLVFKSINQLYKDKSIEMKNVTIYTDSLFCCNLFKITGFAKLDYYYQLLQKIFKKINGIHKIANGMKIKIIKIKSHSNIEGNEIADIIAKKGADLANEAKYKKNALKYNTFNNPIIVDNNKYNSILKKMINNENLNELKQYQKGLLTKDKEKFYCENIFIQMMKYGNNGDEISMDGYKFMNHEFKYLNQKEVSLINKLRTEHINLNNYIYYYHEKNNKEKKEVTNGKCINCKCNETISHYILECNMFDQQRKILFKKLRKIDIKFKNRNNVSIIEILFPHIWQINYTKDLDSDYKLKNDRNTRIRIEILKAIIEFVRKTERFNGEYGE